MVKPPPLSPLEQCLPSSSGTEKEEEVLEVDVPYNYDRYKYKKVLDLINTEEASFDNLAATVIDEALCDTVPLNLMNDSVLHEVIARRKTRLAVAIIRALESASKSSMLRHRNYYGDTPLHIAAMKGDDEVAEVLLENSHSFARERNSNGETPLHKAAMYGHLDVFDIISEDPVGSQTVYDRTYDGSTILHYAIIGDQSRVGLAIVRDFPTLISTRNAFGASPLQIMAAFFKKPPETGILSYLSHKDLTGEKEKQRIADEESGTIGGIMPPNRGNWWSRLPVIGNLRRRIVKAREEMSNYKMNMKLLELLIPDDDYLSSFYFRGSTIQRHTINRPARDITRNGRVMQGEVMSSEGWSVDADNILRWDESPLITGIKLGIDDFVIKILQVSPWSSTYVDREGRNVLQAAVKYGRRLVVKAIKEDEQIPQRLFTALESGTNNTLLHIAASNKNFEKEADPLRLQDELEWNEMLEKIVPPELLNYRNREGKTAREVFDDQHEKTLKECRGQLAEIGRTCSPLLAAVVFTSSFYIPGENNRDSNRLTFKIFSHVYVVGFSCAATSLVMFLLLAVTPFKKRDFRRKVPCHYLMACLLLTMSLAAFIVAFACNMYLQIYGERRRSHSDMATLLLELLLVPSLCALALFLTGASWTFSALKRLFK